MVRTARVGSLTIFIAALVINAVWKFSESSEDNGIPDNTNKKIDHAFSGGVAFSVVMLSVGKCQLD